MSRAAGVGRFCTAFKKSRIGPFLPEGRVSRRECGVELSGGGVFRGGTELESYWTLLFIKILFYFYTTELSL